MAFKPIQIIIGAKDNASAVFSRLQTKVAAVGVAIAGYLGVKAFSGAVESAASFEAAMSRVEAATGATGQELEGLKKAAADAGASSAFTAVQSANALENLAKAGLSSKEAIQALNPVLSLATAADVELATAAEYVTKAVMGMGLSFDDAGRVADVLAKGANASNTSVSGLAEALSYTAPIAKTVGVSLEQTVAIIGKMADSGIDASRAGTALNNVLAKFSDPASKFKRELAAAGITTTDFSAALRQLEAAGPGGEAAIRAVGLEAGPALRSLLNQGTAALDGLTLKLQNAQGSAAEAAAVMQNNLQGSMKGLGSAWESVQNALMTPVLPVLTQGVNQLADAFRASVSDGTIGRFGEIIKTAFVNGLQGAKDFIATLDVGAIAARLQGWAQQAGDAFGKISEYARTAGGVVQTVWGAMSTGANTVMAIIYKVAEAFAGVSSNIQSGVAIILDGLAKITFGGLSASFKAAADEVRLSAEATWAVTQAFADKADQSFDNAAASAETLRSGWATLTSESAAPAEALKTVASAADTVTESATKAAQAQDTQAQAATKNAQAAAENAAAVDSLRGEYAALVAKGDLQGAAQKLQEINQHLRATGTASAAASAGIASVSDAYQLLGITSTEAMRNTAEQSRAAYDVIRESGTASARDVREAFRVAAQSAIDAADGIAPAWVRAEAGMRGYAVQVDQSGKTVLKLASEINAATAATGNLQGAWRGVGAAIDSAAAKAKQLGTDGKEVRDQVSAADAGGSFSALAYQQQAKDVAALDAWWEEWSRSYAEKNWKTGGTSSSFSQYWYQTQQAQYQQARKEIEQQERIEQSAQQKRQAGGAVAGAGGATYVSNITLPGGGGTRQVRFADSASQSAAEQLLRELAQAKGAAS